MTGEGGSAAASGAAPHGASLRFRIILLAASFAVPAAAFQGYLAWRAFENVSANAVREVRASAQAIAAATATAVDGYVDVATGIARAGTVLLDPLECASIIDLSRNLFSGYIGLSVVDAQGTVVCSELPLPAERPSAADRAWFQSLMTTGVVTVSEPVVGRLSLQPVIVLAAPIFGADSAVMGSVNGGMPLTNLARVASRFLTSEGAIATITSRDGIVLSRSQDMEEVVGDTLPRFEYPPLAEGPGWSVFRGPDLRGVDRILGRVDVEPFGWRIYAGIPSDNLLATGYADARNVALGGLLFLLLAFALALWAYRAVTAPLNALIADIGLVAAGGSVEVRTETNELTTVGLAINAMLAARAAAENRQRDFLLNAPFGVLTATAEGRLVESNPALIQMLGYLSFDELKAVGLPGVYADPADRALLQKEVGGRSHYSGLEATWRRKDGALIEVRLSGRAIDLADFGRVYESIAEDVTEHRRLEEIHRHQQKTQAVGRLAGGVAHEINNALTVIGGYAQLLAQKLKGPEEEADLDMIATGVRRAAEMTRSLLAISRRDTARPEPLDPASVVHEMDAMLRRVLPSHIRIELDMAEDCGSVWMNRGHLVQVLLNLGVNARDAMPDGGVLRLTCERRSGPLEGGEWVVVGVEDGGEGIPDRMRSRIFEPFFTTKSHDAGTGLGLATALGLVEQAGGRIEVHSESGVGSRFEVFLPLSTRTEGRKKKTEDLSTTTPKGTEMILVVEDDDALRALVVRVLSKAGYAVTAAPDGAAALALAALRETPFHLVLSDVDMPGMRGPELVQRLVPKSARAGMYMTGYAQGAIATDSVRRECLAKPFETTELLRVVRAVLDSVR